ncbi:ABC transporter permease [Lacticaseibacillus jixianensis]|uniref:ABC transporter permease n=1 Tax=Lacticaseibacillus jixianensis TaxID=2486012 RepID=A0ABW4B9W3_9LACO|nr:ABC transporter permease [Lacticaseibacillus jixianensis]
MANVWFFLNKECLVAWRRYRFLVLGFVFLLVGLESPLIAKLTPTLLKSTLNVTVNLPTPTSLDSWQQFYKNITQIGIFLIAAMFSDTVSREVSRRTLVPFAARGLARSAVLVAKYLMGLILWGGSVLLAFGVTWGYTRYYFPDSLAKHPVLGLLPLLLFGLLLVAVTLFGSTLTSSGMGGFFTVVAGYVVMALLSLVKPLKAGLPLRLVADNLAVVRGTMPLGDLALASGVTGGLTVLFLLAAIAVFSQKRL